MADLTLLLVPLNGAHYQHECTFISRCDLVLVCRCRCRSAIHLQPDSTMCNRLLHQIRFMRSWSRLLWSNKLHFQL